MDRQRAIGLVHKINESDEIELDAIGTSVSMSDAEEKVKGILYRAIEARRANIRRGVCDPLVVHAEIELDD